MAVTGKLYGLGVSHLLNAAVDWDTDTIKASLHTASYTPDQDTHDFFNDATNEIAATGGYSAGGVALANKTRTYNTGANEVRLDCDDIVFSLTLSKTFRYVVVYKVRGGASSADELIGYIDLGSDQTTDQTFTLTVHAEGLFKAVVA